MNTDKNKIGKLLHNLSAFWKEGKMWVADYGEAPKQYVAAGNPTRIVSNLALQSDSDDIDSKGNDANDNGQYKLIVAGNSMLPKGICDGDRLSCTPVKDNPDIEVKQGDFVIIKVDRNYYFAKGQSVRFAHKLRCVIMNIGREANFDKMYDEVKRIDDSVLLDHNKAELRKKFKVTRDYYGAEEPLMLSSTYKEGTLHYSFHPVKLIEAVAVKTS
ncbi:MAG: S24 family peptidase [Bacteroides sp.]|nr:S24 family peptidase [Bacteroidales bacterium]MBD5305641.1 S24 family peptidase [Bacteroides sp.]